MEIRGALAGLLLEEFGEMGEVRKTQIVGYFFDRLIRIQQESFGLGDDAFMDHLQRCFGAMDRKQVGDGFGSLIQFGRIVLHLVFFFEVQFHEEVILADEFKRLWGGCGGDVLSFGHSGELYHQVYQQCPQHARFDVFLVVEFFRELLVELFYPDLVIRLQVYKHRRLGAEEEKSIATHFGIVVLQAVEITIKLQSDDIRPVFKPEALVKHDGQYRIGLESMRHLIDPNFCNPTPVPGNGVGVEAFFLLVIDLFPARLAAVHADLSVGMGIVKMLGHWLFKLLQVAEPQLRCVVRPILFRVLLDFYASLCSDRRGKIHNAYTLTLMV